MERLIRYFISRPLVVNVLIVAMTMISISTIINMQKEGFPRVSMNTVVVTTRYPGASAQDVEMNVTALIEEALAKVAGIDEVLSISQDNISQVTIHIDEDANEREFILIFDEIDKAIARIDDLPANIDGRPIFKQVSSDDTPIIEIALSGPDEQLRAWEPKLVSTLKQVQGISDVTTVGLPDQEILILIDPDKARLHKLDLRGIARAIETRNIHGSGGSIESFLTEKKVVSYNKFHHPTDILETNIRTSVEGRGIKLKQVANLVTAPESVNLKVHNNGQPGASIIVTKKPQADIIKTIDELKEKITALNLPDDIQIHYLNDQSQFTRNRLKLLGSNALFGLILVLFLLFWIMGAKTALWVGFGIPFSLLLALALTALFGLTLNAIALGGFVLILGMLVDDTIVIADQISRFRESGMSGSEAALAGVKAVWQPVFASMITTVIAFLPIAYLGGLPGKFVWAIPVVVALTLFASLLEGYFFLPSHLAHVKAKKSQKSGVVPLLENGYRKSLKVTLKFRYLVVLGFIIVFGIAVYLANQALHKDPFPQDAAEGLTVKLTLPHDANLESTEKAASTIEEILMRLPAEEVIGFSTRLGTQSVSQATDRGSHSNRAIIFVYLSPFAERQRTAVQIGDELREQMTSAIPPDSSIAIDLMRIGPPVGKAFEVRIKSNDNDNRKIVTEEIKSFLNGVEGVTDVVDDQIRGKDEVNVMIDYDLLARTGLTVSDVITTLRIAYDGLIVTDLATIDGRIDFRLQLNQLARADMSYIERLPILNQRGKLINLRELVTLVERPAAGEILHVNQERTTTVSGGVNRNLITPEQVVRLIQENFAHENRANIDFAGEPIENEKIFKDLRSAMILAIFGTYFVITLILNSLAKPAIVMTAVPFGAIGVILALFFHKMPLSMFAMISLIGLTGIIVNASIIMVYAIDSSDHSSIREKIIDGAVSRLRPILLSVLTTVSGLFPTAYGIGGYDPFISPMCLAMGYGLLFGTMILLLLVPCFYAIGDDLSQLRHKVGKKSDLKLVKIASIVILIIAGTFMPAPEASAEPASLAKLLEEVETHPLSLKANAAITGANAERSLLEASYDSRIIIQPSLTYDKSPSESPLNFGESIATRRSAVNVNLERFTSRGFTVGAGLEASQTSVEDMLFLSRGQTLQPLSRDIDLHDLRVKAYLKIPLLKGKSNEIQNERYASQTAGIVRKETERAQILAKLQWQIVQAYWQAYLKTEELNLAHKILAKSRRIHQANQNKHRLGIIDELEVLESQLYVENQEKNLNKREGQYKLSLAALNMMLQRPLDQQITALEPIKSLAINDHSISSIETSEVLKSHPFYNTLLASLERLEHERALIRLENKNTFDLTFTVASKGRSEQANESLSQTVQGDLPTLMAGISFIGNWQKTRERYASIAAESRQTEWLHEKHRIEQEVEHLNQQTLIHLQTLNQQLIDLEQIMKIKESLAQLRYDEFMEGRSTTQELISSQLEVDSSQMEITATQISKHLIVAEYLLLSGLNGTYRTIIQSMQ
ncbi:MAG: efflux RND transporter permease subunit [Oligoflexus sp.]